MALPDGRTNLTPSRAVALWARFSSRGSVCREFFFSAGAITLADPLYPAIDLDTGPVTYGVDSTGDGTVTAANRPEIIPRQSGSQVALPSSSRGR
jgi:hypothetical protein